MPRDLLADRKTLDGMPQLSRESAASPPAEPSSPLPTYNSAKFAEQYFKKMDRIRPFGLLLNPDDLDDCDWLEHAAFDPIEAATREKVRIIKALHSALCLRCVFVSSLSLQLSLRYHDWASVRR